MRKNIEYRRVVMYSIPSQVYLAANKIYLLANVSVRKLCGGHSTTYSHFNALDTLLLLSIFNIFLWMDQISPDLVLNKWEFAEHASLACNNVTTIGGKHPDWRYTADAAGDEWEIIRLKLYLQAAQSSFHSMDDWHAKIEIEAKWMITSQSQSVSLRVPSDASGTICRCRNNAVIQGD